MTALRFDQLVFESLFYLLGFMVQSAIHYLSLVGAFSKFPSKVAEKLSLRGRKPHKTFESLVIFSDAEYISFAETKRAKPLLLFSSHEMKKK